MCGSEQVIHLSEPQILICKMGPCLLTVQIIASDQKERIHKVPCRCLGASGDQQLVLATQFQEYTQLWNISAPVFI